MKAKGAKWICCGALAAAHEHTGTDLTPSKTSRFSCCSPPWPPSWQEIFILQKALSGYSTDTLRQATASLLHARPRTGFRAQICRLLLLLPWLKLRPGG